MSKNAEVDYFIFAENIINAEFNKITLVNIFEEVYAPILPTVQFALNVCIKIEIFNQEEGSKLDLMIRITSPEGEVIGTSEVENLKPYNSKKPGYYLSLDAAGMPIKTYGMYKYELLLDNEVIASKSINVIPKQETEED